MIPAAEIDAQKKIGIARLVRLGKDSLELAGVSVLKDDTNKGVAEKLIEFFGLNTESTKTIPLCWTTFCMK